MPPSPRWLTLTLRALAIAAAVFAIGSAITGALPDGVAIFADRNDCFSKVVDCTRDLVLVGHERAGGADQLPLLVVMVLGALIVALRPRLASVLVWLAGTIAAIVVVVRLDFTFDFRDTRELWPAHAYAALGVAALATLGLAVILTVVAAIARRARPVSHAVAVRP